jgi:hypothetical protein
MAATNIHLLIVVSGQIEGDSSLRSEQQGLQWTIRWKMVSSCEVAVHHLIKTLTICHSERSEESQKQHFEYFILVG